MNRQSLERAASEIREGMAQAKCLKCGCMRDALDDLSKTLPDLAASDTDAVAEELKVWAAQLEDQMYGCAGCAHCYAAVASNILHDSADDLDAVVDGSIPVLASSWPPLPGEYTVLGEGPRHPVAVSTLGSAALADDLAASAPLGMAIVAKTETENIGIDKLIANTISNPNLQYLLLAGIDPAGHLPGQTVLALSANGVDDRMRVIDSPGRRPHLKNVSRDDVETFRRQVKVVDMIGVCDVNEISDQVAGLTLSVDACASCSSCSASAKPSIPGAGREVADEYAADELDRAGYFVIMPKAVESKIIVEHYGYDDRLLHTVEGADAKSLYFHVIKNGWLTQLSHAAYLGKELERAELSMTYAFKYIQDGM